jgi:penicillin-binding protein 2
MVGAAAGLETGKIKFSTTYYCPGSLQVGSRQFKCWSSHGDQDLIQAIANSCDVFFYKIGLGVGAQTLHDYAARFGFGKPTGIELPYESSGNVPNPFWKRMYKFQRWYDGDTANLVIGQGALLTSPMQVCRMTAVFANGGSLVTPYIIKAIDGRDVSASHRRISSVRLRRSTIDNIRKGMRQVVTAGTANTLADARVAVAGKTGTAQTAGDETHAWFTGFFPFDRPQYCICVFLEKGGHGSDASGLVKQIIASMDDEGLFK